MVNKQEDFETIKRIIMQRRSIHKFKDIPVPQDIWGQLVGAANYAPCAGNIQSTRIVVVTNKENIEHIARYCYEQAWITTAPLVMVVCGLTEHLERFYRSDAQRFAYDNAAAATQNLILTAQSLGLGSCWVGAFQRELLSEQLKIPSSALICSVIALGYPDEQIPTPPKATLRQFVFFESFGSTISDIDSVFGNFSSIAQKNARSTRQMLADILRKRLEKQ